MTIDYAHGGTGNGNGNGNGNENGTENCQVVLPGFIPPGLKKKCGWTDEEYPDMHPGGPRDGWDQQYKKEHWELNFINALSLALQSRSRSRKQTAVNGRCTVQAVSALA